MNVATPSPATEVGVRELKNNLSRYIERVEAGEVIVVTDRGRPVARLSQVSADTVRLAELVDAGVVRPPASRARARPSRVRASGSVSEYVDAQRR